MELDETYRFRSDFYHDLKLHKEFNKGSMEGNLLFRIIHIILVVTLIWFFVAMVLVLDSPEAYAKAVPGMTAIWLIFEGAQAFVHRGGGIHYKRSLMLNGGQPTHDSVLFYEDRIQTLEQQTGNKALIRYDAIKVVYETENLLLLGMKYQTFLIVDKRGLSGSREELGQFLYEKCPKLRGKKVRNCKVGRIISRIKWVVVLLSLLIALFYHPTLQLNRRLQGQIHNGMSTSEMAAELETFGISGLSPENLVSLDESWTYLSHTKLESLLYRMGLGDRNFENGDFAPAETGVFFSYYWSSYPETMYTDFLRGVAAMSQGQIVIDGIREDWSNADWASYDGYVTVDFILNGEEKHFDAVFYEDWYDEQTFNTLNTMVQDATGKQLYFADFDDIGCFIFLGDKAWAESFAKRTGLEISADINDIY